MGGFLILDDVCNRFIKQNPMLVWHKHRKAFKFGYEADGRLLAVVISCEPRKDLIFEIV